MANPWKPRDRTSDWFAIPRELVRVHLRDLGGPALKLYLYLSFLAQKHTAIHLEVSNSEIEVFCGLHHETVRVAREELIKAKLVTARVPKFGPVIYTLVEADRQDPDGNPVPLNPHLFPDDGGLRKYCAQPGQSARAVRLGRKLLPGYRPRSIPKSGGKSDTPVSSTKQPRCREDRHTVSANPHPTPSQVIESKTPAASDTMLKNSEKKGIAEDQEKLSVVGSQNVIANKKKVTGDGVGKVDRNQTELLEHVASDPVAAALAKKLNAKIRGAIDLRTGIQTGDVGDPGLTPADWWMRKIWNIRNDPKAKAAAREFSTLDCTANVPARSEN